MALTLEWEAHSEGDWGSGTSTARLRKYDEKLGLISIVDEFGSREVKLTATELRELAAAASALAIQVETA